MPHFLTRSELYRIIQRELPPDDVYPDSGISTSFFSTAESDATAAVLADYYTVQQNTYNNYFAISATGAGGRLPDHEILWFGYNLDANANTEAQRLALVVSKIKFQPAPTLWNMLTLVLSLVPVGTRVGIVPYYAARPFSYQVRIYEATITDAQVAAIKSALLAAGPARCTFDIAQNVNLATYGLFFFLPNASVTSLVQNAFLDPNSDITGYTGLVTVDTNEEFDITDQSGNSLTDQAGNHIVTQGTDSEQLTDQAGNIITDQGGNPIVTQN